MRTCWECGGERPDNFEACDTCGAGAVDDAGGPITDAMLHTALLECWLGSTYTPRPNPREHYDLKKLAKIMNGWLEPV